MTADITRGLMTSDRKRTPLIVAVVIPAGPADQTEDTVDSVRCYLDASRHVVVIDDTQGRRPEIASLRDLPDVTVLPAPKDAAGPLGGLWVKLSAGYQFVVEHFDPTILLRLDADALVLGPGLEEAALRAFERDKRVGLLGSYRVDSLGSPRDFGPAARILARESGLAGFRSPTLRSQLRSLLDLAASHGYELGEHCLGAAYVHSGAALASLRELGLLDLPIVARSRSGEDHLMALLTRAAGFEIADFGGPDDPLALKWHGLPYSPEMLRSRKKLVTHSVRGKSPEEERTIRRYFAELRRSDRREAGGAG